MADTLHAPSIASTSSASAQFDRAGRHVTAYVSGELDAASVRDIGSAIAGHIHPDDERVWLDLSATKFCDSSGLKMLFELDRQVSASGGRLVVFNPTPIVRRLLEMCDPDHVIAVRT
ncbi:STAS domain-containing protein [Aquihabitans daechungensis]|uniref:STAS domain-containing protein n=1 Tax=Aquihabitans daechungensis TaxID=1052257 RepID=UPI003BA3CE34